MREAPREAWIHLSGAVPQGHINRSSQVYTDSQQVKMEILAYLVPAIVVLGFVYLIFVRRDKLDPWL